jgi:hypothetical protein
LSRRAPASPEHLLLPRPEVDSFVPLLSPCLSLGNVTVQVGVVFEHGGPLGNFVCA